MQQVPAQAADPRRKVSNALAADKRDATGAWLRGLTARVHKNAATVALANKLARIAWAVLRRGEPFAAGRRLTVAV